MSGRGLTTRGVTLVEMVGVMVILGFLSAVSVPAVRHLDRAGASAGHATLEMLCTMARDRAAATERPHGVVIDRRRETVSLVWTPEIGGPREAVIGRAGAGETVYSLESVWPVSVTGAVLSTNSGEVWWNARGEPVASEPADAVGAPIDRAAQIRCAGRITLTVHPRSGALAWEGR